MPLSWFRRRPAAPRFGAHSDTGPVRRRNEDSYGLFAPANGVEGEHLFVVADGMGGHAHGQEASRLALRTVHEAFVGGEGTVEERLEAALVRANAAVWDRAGADGRREVMGTTCTALALVGGRAFVAHVGDSRAYRVRRRGVVQLTHDHTLVEELRRGGVLTDEQARADTRRHALTRALGTAAAVEVDVHALGPARAGDRFLLCSDGLAPIEEPELGRVLLSEEPEAACRVLVARAAEAGSTDNATALAVYV